MSDGNRERGEAIQRRRLAQGFSPRKLHEKSGVSREAITAAEAGKARGDTYQRLEHFFDAWEHEVGEDAPDRPVSIEQIEFTVEGDFGVKVTVKGPITDRAQLEESVAKIIRSIRDGG